MMQRSKLKVGNLGVGRTGFCLICCIDLWTLAVKGTVNRTRSACHSILTLLTHKGVHTHSAQPGSCCCIRLSTSEAACGAC